MGNGSATILFDDIGGNCFMKRCKHSMVCNSWGRFRQNVDADTVLHLKLLSVEFFKFVFGKETQKFCTFQNKAAWERETEATKNLLPGIFSKIFNYYVSFIYLPESELAALNHIKCIDTFERRRMLAAILRFTRFYANSDRFP